MPSLKINWDAKPQPLKCYICEKPITGKYYYSDIDGKIVVLCKDCFKVRESNVGEEGELFLESTNREGVNINIGEEGEFTKETKATKEIKLGDKGDKGEEGELFKEYWYPSFQLTANPFQFYDYRVEVEYGVSDNLGYTETEGSRLIHNLAISRCSAFIVGERGCGKTTALDLASLGLKDYFVVLEPRTVIEIFNQVWTLGVNPFDDERAHKEVYNEALRRRVIPQSNICEWEECKRKSRCSFPFSKVRDYGYIIYSGLINVEVKCPLKEWLFQKLKPYASKENIFLIDAPDDLLNVGVYEFSKLIAELLSLGTVIITATPEQYNLCLKSDTLARLIKYDFPTPSISELKEIIINRVRAFQNWNESTPLPFSDDALEYIISISQHNIRKTIYNCQKVILTMRESKRKEPASLEFVQKILPREETGLTVEAMIKQIIKNFRTNKREWASAKEVSEELMKKYNVNVSPQRVGRILSDWLRQGILLDNREYHGKPQYRL